MTDYAAIKNINKRRLAFLDDTAKYYNINNRGVVPNSLHAGGRCQYASTEKSPGCAIGRHVFTNVAKELDQLGNIIDVYSKNRFDLLPLWMREMGVNFLSEMQQLHDNGFDGRSTYWDENGLTFNGIQKFESIKQLIETGKCDF